MPLIFREHLTNHENQGFHEVTVIESGNCMKGKLMAIKYCFEH